jgi:hypothetical protein
MDASFLIDGTKWLIHLLLSDGFSATLLKKYHQLEDLSKAFLRTFPWCEGPRIQGGK